MRIKISRNLYIILSMDVILLCLSFYVAHLIRFDFVVPPYATEKLIDMLSFVVVIKIVCFYFFDLYKGMWRYTGLNDLINIVRATTISSLGVIALILYMNRFNNISRSVFIIDWCLTIILIIGLRVFTRLCFSHFTKDISLDELKNALFKIVRTKQKNGKGVLIIGAGDCGQMVCREFRDNASVKSHLIGFLDDDKAKIGRKIHGVPVLGIIDDLKRIVESEDAEEVIIAIPSASSKFMKRIAYLCRKADVEFKTVPGIGEVIDGKVTINSIRNVEYRDLLGRDPVRLNKDEIGRYIDNQTILVTGAAGSIGTGLCRQICRYNPKRIVLFERAESPLYELDLELKKNFTKIEVIPVLGDIQDKEELCKTFSQYTPNIVFHAAAYKHVPMLEHHPWKAVENNIMGTRNLVNVAHEFKCRRFVFVSTDKAVNPTNVMGASKRVSEMIVQNQNFVEKSVTSFITVRFGNVIGSVGSVIPLFKKQIKDGGPVTVTHPEMIRYFMLIPEACQLILQAGAMGKRGGVFILEMGEPVNIDKMARDLIRFSGYEPDVDIKIIYTGLRPGEKLYEELMTNQENVVPTAHKKILELKSRQIDLNVPDSTLIELTRESANRNARKIKDLLQKIVPEYQYRQ